MLNGITCIAAGTFLLTLFILMEIEFNTENKFLSEQIAKFLDFVQKLIFGISPIILIGIGVIMLGAEAP